MGEREGTKGFMRAEKRMEGRKERGKRWDSGKKVEDGKGSWEQERKQGKKRINGANESLSHSNCSNSLELAQKPGL